MSKLLQYLVNKPSVKHKVLPGLQKMQTKGEVTNVPERISYSDPRYREMYKNRQVGLNYDGAISLPELDEVTVTAPRSYSMKSLKDFTTAALYGAPATALNISMIPQAAMTEAIELYRRKPYDFSNASPNLGYFGSNQRDLSNTLGYKDPQGFLQNAANVGLSMVDPLLLAGLSKNLVRNIGKKFVSAPVKRLPTTANADALRVLEDFKARIQTPEGIRRMKALGIHSDRNLSSINIVDNVNTHGYYDPRYNEIAINPNKTDNVTRVVRHELEHGSQMAKFLESANKLNKDIANLKYLFKPKALKEAKKIAYKETTEIDDNLAALELKETPEKIDWKNVKSSTEKYPSSNEYLLDNKRATNYFNSGSRGKEKSPFLAEVQQYMMDTGIIPSRDYVNITPKMVEQTMKKAALDKDNGGMYLRFFNIMKDSNFNYDLAANELNKMLGITGAVGTAGLASQNIEQKKKGGNVSLPKMQIAGQYTAERDATTVSNTPILSKMFGAQREVDVNKLDEDSFKQKYNITPHQYKMRSNSDYAQAFQRQMDERKQNDPNYSELNLPATDIRSKNYRGNPNLALIPKGATGPARAQQEQLFADMTSMAAPLLPVKSLVRGLQVGKALTKVPAMLGSQSSKVAKASSTEYAMGMPTRQGTLLQNLPPNTDVSASYAPVFELRAELTPIDVSGIRSLDDASRVVDDWLASNNLNDQLPADFQTRFEDVFKRYGVSNIRSADAAGKSGVQALREIVEAIPNRLTDYELINLRQNFGNQAFRPQEVRNVSGLTKSEALLMSKDKDKISKMDETEFMNTVLKPNGDVAPYYQGSLEPHFSGSQNVYAISPKEYVDEFNSRLDLLNDIIAQNNKSGVEYRVKGLDQSGGLTFYTPQQSLLNDQGILAPIRSGESTWTTNINPGKWQGVVEDIPNKNYYRSIPGLEMSNTSGTVFADRNPRRGTGAYESINEYLKKLNLGRVKPGFNSQSAYSKGAWENFINSGRASGYYGKPGTVYGSMKTFLPIGFGAAALSQEYKKGGPVKLPKMQMAGQNNNLPQRVSINDPRYAEPYKNRQVGSFYDGAYSLPDLDEVTVTGKDERVKEGMLQGSGRFYQGLAGVMGSPQTGLMEVITGKQQTPSQAWGFDTKGKSWYNPKSISNFAMDTVLDPMNLLGVGLIDDVTRGAVRAGARQAARRSGNYLTTKTPLKNTYKINPFAVKEPDVILTRAQKPGQTDELRRLNELEAKGGINNPNIEERFEYRQMLKSPVSTPGYGRWFGSEVGKLGYYTSPNIQDRRGYEGFSEILKLRLPGKEAKNFNVGTNPVEGAFPSYAPSKEFILPQDLVFSSESFIPNAPYGKPGSLDNFIRTVDAEQRIANAPDWLRGYPSVANKSSDVSKSFKSEIDWGKWNPDTPKYPELIKEYNAIEESTKKAGTWMKNPDGSIFKGSPEQFIQQNSTHFKKAFGDSKLLNPDGSPMFLYHGSAKKFDTFDPSKFQLGDAGYSGAGIYTTPSKTTANSYATSSASFHTGDIEPTLYELYGQGNRPIKSSDLIKENQGRDLFNFHRDRNWKGELSPYESLREYDVAVSDQLPNVQNVRPLYDAREIVFPKNTQLKSAVGNVGFFDMTNPNIYKGVIPAGIATALTINQQRNGGKVTKGPLFEDMQFKQGGPILDPRGQWAHPGKRTIVPTPTGRITMQGVPYPVYGQDETGFGQMMYPGGEYKFPGQMVDEIPMFAKGGQHGGLDRWFAEKWVDVKTGKACGRQEGEKRAGYPACRPSKRVSSETPKTSSEMSSAEKAKFKRTKTSSERIPYNHKK